MILHLNGRRWLALFSVLFSFLCGSQLVTAAPNLVNSSFEFDPVPAGAGYGPITGWFTEGGSTNQIGINDASGPFADNGIIPDGAKVAFLQSRVILSQDISGFVDQAHYWLSYRENARQGCCGGVATIEVRMGENTIVEEHNASVPVGGSNQYRLVSSQVFRASGSLARLSFVKDGVGDVSSLIDDIRIIEIPPNTPPTITQDPQSRFARTGDSIRLVGSAVGSPPLYFQWKFNGNDLPDETRSSLTLYNVQSSQAGSYTLVVTNAHGAATSSIAFLTLGSTFPGIINPSFELDDFSVPGYGPITGWTPGGSIQTGYGINQQNGPFADNGTVPNGEKVAFIQNNGSLSQPLTGLRVGGLYWLVYRENARMNCCGGSAELMVMLGNSILVTNHPVTPVGGLNPYRFVSGGPFSAASPTMNLSFIKQGVGDVTVLIDDVQIISTDSLKLNLTLNDARVPAIQVQGIPGRDLALEYKDALSDAEEWRSLITLNLTNGLALYLDQTAQPRESRFYRFQQIQ